MSREKEFLIGGIGRTIESSAIGLETVTRRIDKLFYLEAANIPEYSAAIEAIRKYKEAVVKKIGLLPEKCEG